MVTNNKKENNLFICSTVYQLIGCIQLRSTLFYDDASDLLLTDEIPTAEKIAERLSSSYIFGKVLLVRGSKTELKQGKLIYFERLYLKKLTEVTQGMAGDFLNTDYDKIFFANIGGINYRLAVAFLKCNQKAKLFMFEDGVSSYSRIYGDCIQGIEQKSFVGKLKHILVYHYMNKLSGYYVFDPSLMVWSPACKVYKIPSLTDNLGQIRGILNSIFDYKDEVEQFKEKVIFFEESYRVDGIAVDDCKIVKKLQSIYGRENIIIKTHPRSKDNMFENMGFKTNSNRAMPWELIALNMTLDEKILITMSSSAVLNSYILLSSKAMLIFEYGCLEKCSDNERVSKTLEVIHRAETIYPEIFTKLEDLK